MVISAVETNQGQVQGIMEGLLFLENRVREGLSDDVRLEQRPERRGAVNHGDHI